MHQLQLTVLFVMSTPSLSIACNFLSRNLKKMLEFVNLMVGRRRKKGFAPLASDSVRLLRWKILYVPDCV